jgi:hypothetical protein
VFVFIEFVADRRETSKRFLGAARRAEAAPFVARSRRAARPDLVDPPPRFRDGFWEGSFMANWATTTVGLVLGCVVAAASGCSSAGGSSGASLSRDEFPGQLGNAFCDSIAPCCKAATIAYDDGKCRSAATNYFSGFLATNGGSKATYDATAAAKCLDAVKAALQACVGFEDAISGAACSDVFQGTVPDGGSCVTTADCVNHDECDFDPNAAPGAGGMVCIGMYSDVAPHGKAGDACFGTCNVIADGSTYCSSDGDQTAAPYCYGSEGLVCASDTKLCTKLAPVGAACAQGGCVKGAFCQAGTCAAQLDSGSCLMDPDACSAQTYCEQNTRMCAPKTVDGLFCRDDSECVSGKCEASQCGPLGAASTDMCAGSPSVN